MMTQNVLEKGTGKALPKTRKIRLKDREWTVLSALGRWGILGLGQLDGLAFRECGNEERLRLFFNEYDRISFDHYAYKRLRQLETARLVQGHSKGQVIGGPRRLYSLTRLGRRALIDAHMPGGSLRKSWTSKAARHYIRLNAVGLVLEKILDMKVAGRHELVALNRGMGLPEAQIRQRVPDLLIGERIPLILDSLGAGSRPGYWRKQRERVARERTFYLVSVARYKTWALDWARQERLERAFICDLEDFKAHLGGAVFASPSGLSMTLSEAVAPRGS